MRSIFLLSLLGAMLSSAQPMYAQISETFCPDLVIAKLEIAQVTKKQVQISVHVQNKGTTLVRLGGSNLRENEGAGWQVFLSSDDRFNGGDIFIGGEVFEHRTIQPEQIIVLKGKFSLQKRTSFSNYLIVKLDPHQIIDECDDINNDKSIRLP